mmetsp:Transcript_8572/g.25282  ORF Transcript_8572/g.25282 Transcript_8572/m.25282 type:complete len:332 (-) Transcript_8572:53-1048(-)
MTQTSCDPLAPRARGEFDFRVARCAGRPFRVTASRLGVHQRSERADRSLATDVGRLLVLLLGHARLACRLVVEAARRQPMRRRDMLGHRAVPQPLQHHRLALLDARARAKGRLQLGGQRVRVDPIRAECIDQGDHVATALLRADEDRRRALAGAQLGLLEAAAREARPRLEPCGPPLLHRVPHQVGRQRHALWPLLPLEERIRQQRSQLYLVAVARRRAAALCRQKDLQQTDRLLESVVGAPIRLTARRKDGPLRLARPEERRQRERRRGAGIRGVRLLVALGAHPPFERAVRGRVAPDRGQQRLARFGHAQLAQALRRDCLQKGEQLLVR